MMPEKNDTISIQPSRTLQEEKSLEARAGIEAKARLAAIVDSCEGAIIATGLDGTITDWNKGAEKIYGYQASEAVGGHLSTLAPAGRGDELSRMLERIRQGEGTGNFEAAQMRKDGTVIDVSLTVSPIFYEQGIIIGTSVIARDITEQKRIEQELRESEERYRTLVEWAPDAVIVHRDGRFLYVNCPALGIYGARTREQLQDKNFFDLIHADDLDLVQLQLQQIQAGEKMSPHEFRLLKWDGLAVLVEASGIMIGYDGAPAYLFIMRDITKRKCLEQERLRALEQLHIQEQLLIKQGRFAAIGEMIGHIAHQWRQPLNTLALIVQELPVYYSRDRFSKEYLEASAAKAMQVISQMSKTIDSFGSFFNADKVKLTFKAREVLEKTVSMAEVAFTALMVKIEIVAEDDLSLSGNPNDYSQVILNILMNAREVFNGRRVVHPWVEVKLFREDTMAVVTITDNAGGIAEGSMDKIFDPYFTTKGPEQGTGIGLFMAKTIIEKNMHGTLSVHNVPHGAQFRIQVPEWTESVPLEPSDPPGH